MGQRKGYKQSAEHRQKIAEAKKRGASFNCVICDKTFWRKPFEIEKGNNKFCSKDCYFEWQKGKEKVVKNPFDKNGLNNPNWKGGITPENKKFRQSEEYREWRNSVFKKDDWTCQECGARSKKNNYIRIEAHHIKPFASFPELRLCVKNGITLCKKCHDKEPKGKEIWKIK